MNEIYAQYFKKDPPVRTTVEVARLPFDIMLEIDVIAYLPK
jgi:2-iminobutanoate/2-iminopropanoate deaminase